MEEGPGQSQKERDRFLQERIYKSVEEEFKAGRKEDQPAIRFAAIEQRLNNWYESFNIIVNGLEKSFSDIGNELRDLKRQNSK